MTERPPTDDDLPSGWRRPFVRFWWRYEWRGVALVGVVVVLLAVVGGWSFLHRDAPGQVADRTNSYVFGLPGSWHADLDCSEHSWLRVGIFRGTCVRPNQPATDDPLAGVYVDAGYDSGAQSAGPGPTVQGLAGGLAGYDACGQPVVDGTSATLCLSGGGKRAELRVKVYPVVVLVALCLRTDVPQISHGCDDVWSVTDMRNPGAFNGRTVWQ